ncbi:MAG: hypothetical protein ABMA13_19750 [Chthoniobacteraceae bacterium]
MNANDPLRERLRAWKVEPTIPNRFHADVWARIREREEAREVTGWAGFLSWLFPSRTAWQLAAVTAAVVVAVGAGLGNINGGWANERSRAELALRYAQSVDPYLQVTLSSAK